MTPLNKTLTYRARRSDAETERPAERKASAKNHSWLQRIGLVILLLAVLASAVNILSLSNRSKVLPLTSGSRGFLRPTATYEQAANRLLADSIWNRNKLTVDSGRVRRELLKQFPELASVTVTVPLLAHRPLVYIQPSQPALLLTATNGTFVVDSTGKTLLRADSLTSPLSLPTLIDQGGLRLQLNHQALPAKQVAFIQTVIAQLAAKHFVVTTLSLPRATSELDVQLNGQPYSIKFNFQSDTARLQAGTFLATIAQLQKQGVTPAHYIDVRVDGRAYYQ
jgi:hypothetical protein